MASRGGAVATGRLHLVNSCGSRSLLMRRLGCLLHAWAATCLEPPACAMVSAAMPNATFQLTPCRLWQISPLLDLLPCSPQILWRGEAAAGREGAV